MCNTTTALWEPSKPLTPCRAAPGGDEAWRDACSNPLASENTSQGRTVFRQQTARCCSTSIAASLSRMKAWEALG